MPVQVASVAGDIHNTRSRVQRQSVAESVQDLQHLPFCRTRGTRSAKKAVECSLLVPSGRLGQDFVAEISTCVWEHALASLGTKLVLAKKAAVPAPEPIALPDAPLPIFPAGQAAREGLIAPDEAAYEPAGSSSSASRRNSDVSVGSFVSAQDIAGASSSNMDVQVAVGEVAGHGGALSRVGCNAHVRVIMCDWPPWTCEVQGPPFPGAQVYPDSRSSSSSSSSTTPSLVQISGLPILMANLLADIHTNLAHLPHLRTCNLAHLP